MRLDKKMVEQGIAPTRSQAESYIRLGKVQVNDQAVTKAGHFVRDGDKISLSVKAGDQYVSRAGMKLASVVEALGLNFKGKLVLDVGSSTGGFTDYALRAGAKKVVAVDVGTDQLHPSLRDDLRIELHEKTDIRDFKMVERPQIVVVDVSFISLREVLPSVRNLCDVNTQIVAMLKPQFEAGKSDTNKGIVKNDKLRRQIMKDFEAWAKNHFVVVAKADSEVAGSHGNQERFYLLKLLTKKPQGRARP